jgi:hypothetical protein
MKTNNLLTFELDKHGIKRPIKDGKSILKIFSARRRKPLLIGEIIDNWLLIKSIEKETNSS